MLLRTTQHTHHLFCCCRHRRRRRRTTCWTINTHATLSLTPTEHKIFAKHVERSQQWDLVTASSREELEQNVLARMKSVTNADDETCISILKCNSYDLEGSIEAFLSKAANS
jgi:UBA-like domain